MLLPTVFGTLPELSHHSMSHYPVCYATLQLLHVLYAPGYVFSNVVTPAAEHCYTSNPTSRNSLFVGSEQRAHATSAYVSPPRPAFKGSNLEQETSHRSACYRNQQLQHADRPFGAQKRRYSDLSTRELPSISPFLPHPVIAGPI